jgi:type IV pilus assembly protein PilO
MAATTQTRFTLPKLPKRENTAVPRSQIERLWLVAGGLVAFVMLLIGYFFFISPQRSNTADVDQQTATVQQQNSVLQARLDALREQNKDLGRYQAQLTALQHALPSTSGISDFLRTLQSLGSATLTNVTGLTVGEPIDVTPVSVVAPTAAVAPTTSAPTTAAAPVAPVATTPGVYGLPITATVTGSAGALTKFLDQLQSVQPRAVLITQLSLGGLQDSTTPTAGSFTMDLTMQAFVAPVSPSEGAALSTSAGN